MIWTQALSDAAKAVYRETEPHPYWPESDAGIKSRAKEFMFHPVGSTLQPFQVEYLACFTQRLDYSIGGPHQNRPSHEQFRQAMAAAQSEENS